MPIEKLLEELRSVVPEVTAEEAERILQARSDAVLVDVREEAEIASEGRIPGSVHVPRGSFEMIVEGLVPNKDRPIVVYCAAGSRSLLAAEAMIRLGYRDVFSLAGGLRRWSARGQAVERPRVLTPEDRERYSRHLKIPEFGVAGQLRLLDARVLIVGVGGIGSPAALYLAAAGVGTLGVLDFDTVDSSNLQRQVLHRADRVGMAKALSARETLLALNPGIHVVAYEERLDSRNANSLFSSYDLIVDGSDNFPTRYLVNDAAVLTGKPVVHGSVAQFEGQVTVFDPPRGPCYRCMFPEPPPPELAPNCAEAGVLGVLPGVIGLLVAVEAIKLLVGLGEPLVGGLLVYDALKSRFRRLNTRRDPACRYCGDGVEFPGLIDQAGGCASRPAPG